MKKFFSLAAFVLFLLSLWVYQLPRSPIERRLMTIFSPIASYLMTDRQYRMYAPNPRPAKPVPSLMVRTAKGRVIFYKGPSSNIFTREKWDNFVDRLAKKRSSEDEMQRQEAGELFFKLAEKICNSPLEDEDRALAVTLQTRSVDFEQFREDIVWEEPEVLANVGCGGRGGLP